MTQIDLIKVESRDFFVIFFQKSKRKSKLKKKSGENEGKNKVGVIEASKKLKTRWGVKKSIIKKFENKKERATKRVKKEVGMKKNP